MKQAAAVVLLSGLALWLSGCAVFISGERLRGPVPSEAELAAAAAAAATPELSAEQQARASANGGVIADLQSRVGQDLTAQATFSGRETPRSAPLRGARIEAGDTIRISSSRAQQIAQEAEEYCVEQGQRCSSVWVYGRASGGTIGAWYPITIFDYALD